MKFAKVMFLHVSVCPQGGEYLGRSPKAGTPLGRYTSLGRYTPWAGTSPWAGKSPWAGTSPLGRYTPLPQFMLGYSQQAGGTHPIGMHSCFSLPTCLCANWGHVVLCALRALKQIKLMERNLRTLFCTEKVEDIGPFVGPVWDFR